MNRTEFILVTTVILLAAFAMGWFTHWVLHRFARVPGGDMAEVDRLAQALHDAEETRDQALVYIEQREEELTNQLTQAEAELRAAMDGLRDVRAENDEMRSYIDQMQARA
jgi:septal ring factor EnvC (AmiA/AmiB activator)